MEYGEFERRASEVWSEIPETYRAGVDGLVIQTEERAHPTLQEIYTLGECVTESYPSDWGGPDTVRSVLVLYHGSFRRLSDLDPDFDWEYEVWETITHELRHHLESLAAEDALEDVDYAMDENFKRFQGESFDPFFYRAGEPLGRGMYQAEREIFLERVLEPGAPPESRIPFDWLGKRYTVPAPDELADVTFIQVAEGIDTSDASLCLVLVRRRRFRDTLRSWFRKETLSIADVDAAARPADDD